MEAKIANQLVRAVSLQGKQADVRRVAEVHFKVGLALQFLQNPAKALHHTQVSRRLGETHVQHGPKFPPPLSSAGRQPLFRLADIQTSKVPYTGA